MVKYEYDAWGNHVVFGSDGQEITDPEHIGNKNPFRYRGYYYDVETGLYYLQTRYYDPKLCRFISQDSIDYADPETINGLNLYAYCSNNPVMAIDPTGTFVISTLLLVLATIVIGSVVSGLMSGAVSAAAGEGFWSGFIGGLVSGAITTVGVALAVTTRGIGGLFFAGAFGFIAGFSGSVLQQGIAKGFDNIDLWSATISGVMTSVTSIVSFGFSRFLMTSSAGLFEDCFDPTLKFGEKFINVLKLSPESMMLSIVASFPFSFSQMLIDLLRLIIENSKDKPVVNVIK